MTLLNEGVQALYTVERLPRCSGVNDGKVVVDPSGAKPPYLANWEGAGTPVCLVVAGLVDERNRQLGANFLERRRGFESHLAGLDDTGPRNQEKGLVETDIEAAEFHGDSFQPPC